MTDRTRENCGKLSRTKEAFDGPGNPYDALFVPPPRGVSSLPQPTNNPQTFLEAARGMLPVEVSPDLSFGPSNRASHDGMPSCYIVDDDAQTRHFLSVILYGHGIRTEEFFDAPSFLQAVGRHSPDLVFLNIGRDARDAIGLTDALAQQGYFGFIQLMSTRGAAVLEHVKKIIEQQKLVALAGLTKPFQGREIVNIIHSLGLGDAAPAACRFGLDEALENNWIEYWYQPKIDLRRKQLVGAEAFVRARHPEYGRVLPIAFLPGATDHDLLSLARHTVTSVLEAEAKFSELGVRLRLSINFRSERSRNCRSSTLSVPDRVIGPASSSIFRKNRL